MSSLDGADEPSGEQNTTVQFQHGSDGYAGGVDTYVHGAQPGTSRATATTLNVDSADNGGAVQALLRFDDLFGSATGQIPPGATILSATLELQTTGKGDGAKLHRMLQSWSDTATWDSLDNGIQADDAEAMAQADLDTGFLAVGTSQLDVTASLQAWASGQANHGWAFLPTGSDGWDFLSAEGSSPPKLIVEYSTSDDDDPTNSPPVATDDSATTEQDTAVEIAVLANDSDPDGDPLTVGSVTQPTNGTISINADGTVTYTPDEGFVGDDSFTYRASDGSLESDPATVSLSVTEVDEPPASTTVQFQHGSGGYAGGVDTYVHGAQPGTSRATATTLNVDSADNGGAVQALLRFDAIFGSGTGQIPLGATILSATLELQTTGKGDGAKLHRMLQPWNDTATWDSLENGIQADDVEAMSQSDLDTGFLAVGTSQLDVTASLQAWASGQANHGWAFLPTGSDGWDFLSAEGSSPPKLIVEYSPPDDDPTNNPPVANGDSATTEQDTAVEIAVLANDSDPDGDPLTVGSVTQPTNGSVTVNANGTITYTPNHGFHGSDSFTYRASDGHLLSDPATVNITINEADEPPASTTVQFQHGSGGYAGGVDTYLHGAQPGTSRATATTLNVDSADNGGAVQTLLRFDAIFGSATGQIPLGATILSATLELQTTGKGDGAKLHRMLQPWNDTATWNSLDNGIQADGVEAMIQSDLNTGFVGTGTTRLDVTASLQAWADGQLNHGWAFLPTGSDGWDFLSAEGSSPPKLIVEYSPPDDDPTNNPPVATDDSATTEQDTAVEIAVLANDSDPDGDPLTVGSVTQPTNGSVAINANGTITYTPDEGFVGDDSFTYRASDGQLLSDPATVNITINEADEPPTSTTVQFQHGSGGYAGGVDTYVHGAQPGTSRATATTLNVDSADKGGAVQALLRFDDLFGSATGQIPPGATILSATLELQTTGKGDGAKLHRMLQPWSDTATWDSLDNGIQADGIEAMLESDLNTGFVGTGTTQLDVTASLQAWASGQANHGWAFLPTGSDGWDFLSAEGSSPPKLIVEYTTEGGEPTNNPPIADDDSATTEQGAAVEIAVLANDSDPDGDPLTVGSATQPASGSVAINANGTITYTPNHGFHGSDSFTYRAYDGQLLSDPATVNVTVTQSDDPPPLPLETSYIATAFNTSDRRNFEHTNATKSFYHDGVWWGVLPEQSGWHVYRFDGTLPDPGTMGGWIKSSPTMLTSGRRADIAWDDDTDTLYVLNFGPTETSPRLFQLGYSAQTGTFEIDANIQLAGSGGKLTGAEWQKNTEMALGLDQNGNPVVALIGPSAAGGEKGLKLAYPTSSDLGTWATTTIDSGPSTTSSGNGDNKVDFVAFQLNGVDHVGLAYGDDATGLWKFAYQPTPASPADYGSGWTIETITGEVNLDNHLAALWDGNAIIMTMKDDKDALWAVKGVPGNWEDPVLVHAATHGASRPTLAYDEDNEMVFIFYQENTSRPYGDIHYKSSSASELVFDAQDPGVRILASTRPDEYMSDPQMPTHSVGSATDGMFFVFARNPEAREIWYNDFVLADDPFIA